MDVLFLKMDHRTNHQEHLRFGDVLMHQLPEVDHPETSGSRTSLGRAEGEMCPDKKEAAGGRSTDLTAGMTRAAPDRDPHSNMTIRIGPSNHVGVGQSLRMITTRTTPDNVAHIIKIIRTEPDSHVGPVQALTMATTRAAPDNVVH